MNNILKMISHMSNLLFIYKIHENKLKLPKIISRFIIFMSHYISVFPVTSSVTRKCTFLIGYQIKIGWQTEMRHTKYRFFRKMAHD